MLAVSLAVAKAAAQYRGEPLYEYLAVQERAYFTCSHDEYY